MDEKAFSTTPPEISLFHSQITPFEHSLLGEYGKYHIIRAMIQK